jgi:hypothetical protein
MATKYITLPRSQLYKLVWSKPVRDVAADFGISDVALAKRCRALNIPLPWRGYWEIVAAGRMPRFDYAPSGELRLHATEPGWSYITHTWKDSNGTPTDFLAWADRSVNQVDPLHPEPRDTDFAHERSWQYGADDNRFPEELQRLLGHTWEHAAKLP